MEASTEKQVTVFVLSSRKPGTTFDEFKTYYENVHVPLVKRLVLHGDVRPLSFTRNYIERERDHSEGKPTTTTAASFPYGGLESWEYDCITRVVFRDVAHRDAMFEAFGQHREEIAADEARYLDPSTFKVIFVAESCSDVRRD